MAQRQFHQGAQYHERNKYGGGQRGQIHPKFHHKLEEELPIKVNGIFLFGVRKDERARYLFFENFN